MKNTYAIHCLLSVSIVASALVAIPAQAQGGADYLKAAENYFNAGDYASAAAYYEKYLHPPAKATTVEYNPYTMRAGVKQAVKGNSQQALYHLAESYRLLTDYNKAEPIYKQLLDAGQFPLAYLGYATVLRAQAKYGEAEKVLQIFLDRYKTEDANTVAAKMEMQNLRFIQQQLDKKDDQTYSIIKIAEGHDGASYAPAFGPANELYFTTTWPNEADTKNILHTNHIYKADYSLKSIGSPANAGLPEDALHEGTPSISADGNTMYFTRWEVGKAGKKASIYKSSKTNGKWDNPVPLNSIINEAGCNAQQPLLMADGKYLIYASDKKGGLGGFDLWYAELNTDGQPITTKNLGETINTPLNDEAPAYHQASGTLVFASNGRVGMGGYDLFYSKGQLGNFSTPQNFGYPVNSIKDDIYFATTNQAKYLLSNAVISSDRTATCCLQLFSISKTYLQHYSGVVVDCNTQSLLAGAAVIVTDASGKKLAETTSDSKGGYDVEALDGAVLTITANKNSYVAGSITTDVATSGIIENKAICLMAVVVPAKPEIFKESKLEVRNILFAFNQTNIPVADYAFFDQVADYMKANPTANIEIGAYTDGKGTVAYNLILSAKRAQACFDYLVKAGVAKERMTPKGYGECCPLEKEFIGTKDNPAAREKNRRVEIKLL